MICAASAESLHLNQFTCPINRHRGYHHYLSLALCQGSVVTFMRCFCDLLFAE